MNRDYFKFPNLVPKHSDDLSRKSPKIQGNMKVKTDFRSVPEDSEREREAISELKLRDS